MSNQWSGWDDRPDRTWALPMLLAVAFVFWLGIASFFGLTAVVALGLVALLGSILLAIILDV